MLSEQISDPRWKSALKVAFASDDFSSLQQHLSATRTRSGSIFPPENEVFRAFNLTPFATVKVVILGQDPYHGAGQAMGLAFSVRPGVTVPPSLRNIRREIADDIGRVAIESGDLTLWAQQGVLLLNSVLTVEESRPGSHAGLGWETFTDSAIRAISNELRDVVFMLWGNYARQKKTLIDHTKHKVLEAPHPSPLSAHRGFMGCKHFSQANDHLLSLGHPPINW